MGVEKIFLAKKAIVALNNGSNYTFNYGALNAGKLAGAIRAN
jgi:hypothetical protein